MLDFTLESRQQEPEEFAAAASRGRGGRRRGRGLPLRPQAARRPRAARAARLRGAAGAAARGRLVDRDPASPARGRGGARPRACSAARRSWTGSSSAATSAAARSATRRRTSRSIRACSCLGYGIYAGQPRSSHRAAISIGTNPHYGGEERRIEPYLLDFEGDLYGRRLVVELWERLRDEQVFESEQELIDQIARDVEATRKAVRPGVGRLIAVSENGAMIHARGLVKRFGDLVAVDGIDLDVRRGRGVRLPRPERRGQELDDADDRLRLAGQRRDAADPRPRPRRGRRRRSGRGSASSRSRTRSTPS